MKIKETNDSEHHSVLLRAVQCPLYHGAVLLGYGVSPKYLHVLWQKPTDLNTGATEIQLFPSGKLLF